MAYIAFVEKLVRTWKALVGEAQRKHRRLGLDGVLLLSALSPVVYLSC